MGRHHANRSDWLEEVKKKDERKKMEELHQQRVSRMIKSAEGSAGLLHKITKPAAWRGGAQVVTIVKQKGKNGRSTGVQ